MVGRVIPNSSTMRVMEIPLFLMASCRISPWCGIVNELRNAYANMSESNELNKYVRTINIQLICICKLVTSLLFVTITIENCIAIALHSVGVMKTVRTGYKTEHASQRRKGFISGFGKSLARFGINSHHIEPRGQIAAGRDNPWSCRPFPGPAGGACQFGRLQSTEPGADRGNPFAARGRLRR